MTDLQTAARALNGRVVSGWVRFAPPGHSRSDDSGAMRLDPTSDDGIRVKTFSLSDDPILVREYVRDRLGIVASGRRSSATPPSPRLAFTSGPDDAERKANAIAIWREARDPRGTPVQVYLRHRGLDLPEEAAGEVIRYHSECPFAGQRTPAMVCLVRDVVTNEPNAIHRTALTQNSHKAKINGKDRLALGPIGRGAIKLTPDEDVTTCLGIGEGIESVLSLRNMTEFGLSPVWSLISAGGVESFPIQSGIESLWLAFDHDETGIRAARSTAQRWRTAGAEAFLITPSAPRADLNDLFFAGLRHA